MANYKISGSDMFPMIDIELNLGQEVYIQRGSMVCHDPGIRLTTDLNASGSGIGQFMRAVGRSMVSGESALITKVVADQKGSLGIAATTPGQIVGLELGLNQYCLNDGVFLAMDGSAGYTMERQAVNKALFSGTGGLFVMTTQGTGSLLINAFGSVKKIVLNNEEVTIDNSHVLAWSTSLSYNIHTEGGFLQSLGTGEGLVNTFRGTGEVYVQSLNLASFASSLAPYLPSSKS